MARFRFQTITTVGGGCTHRRLVESSVGWIESGSWPCGQSPYPSNYFPRIAQPQSGQGRGNAQSLIKLNKNDIQTETGPIVELPLPAESKTSMIIILIVVALILYKFA